MPSFSIPLTGLESDNVSLNAIANNLSNMNTTAYKSQAVDFGTLLYQSLGLDGAGDPLQIGTGVAVASTESNFQNGPISNDGNPEHMALNGDGFFVVQQGGQDLLTRDGSFTLSSGGLLIDAQGNSVMGYPAVAGVVNPNAQMPISLPVGQVQAPQATTNVSLTMNLNAATAAGSQYPAPIQIYDSLGQAHNAVVTFTNSGPNSWTYNVALPSGEAASSTNTSGTIMFDNAGNITSPVPATPAMTFSGLSDGARNLTFSLQSVSSSGTSLITQFAGSSSVAATSQDGFAPGKYSGFTVSSDGLVSASFENGNKVTVGQLIVAGTSNPQGLSNLGSNYYRQTLASGSPVFGTAGSGGLGTVQSGALEGSNVDISTQFADLIVAQRAFEANSKTVSTFDTVAQDTINMIR